MFQSLMLRTVTFFFCILLLWVPDANAQSGSVSSNSPCQLAAGQSTCSVNLNWSKSNTPIACLWVLSSGGLFACSGNDNDSAVWTYASLVPDILILRAHTSWDSILGSAPEIARTTVRASAPVVAAYQSSFVGQNVPATMTAGQTYAVSVTIRNDGSDTWSAAANYNLGSQNVQDNTVWGLGRVATPGTVGSGQEVIFSFNVTAPSTPGTYNFQWRMVRDGVTWFGAQTTNVAITVVAPAQQLAPTCSSVVPSASTTTGTTGTFRVYAYGVTNTTSMVFPTWGDAGGQDDLYWYPGINAGNGTWYVEVNLANHKAGAPEYGTFYTSVYMSNSTHAYVPCAATSWTRTAATPSSQFGWDYNLTKRCAKTVLGPGSVNYFSDVSECAPNDKRWTLAVQSEVQLGQSCTGGPNNQSYPINAAGSPTTFSYSSHASELGANWAANIKVNHDAYPSSCAGSNFTWFAFMDHEAHGGGPFPPIANLKSSHRLNYNHWVAPGLVGGARLILGAQFTWAGKSHLIEIMPSTLNWGDSNTHPGVLLAMTLADGTEYVQLDGPYWNLSISPTQEKVLVVPWKDLVVSMISNGWFSPIPAGQVSSVNAVFVAVEAQGRGIADLRQTDFRIYSE
jgi:uncharacterized protein affecting Mg2+/Co2+ transport